MNLHRLPAFLPITAALFLARSAFCDDPKLPGIGAAMEEMVKKKEVAGAVTIVETKDKILHMESTGLADVASGRPITPESMFWIASMSKPVTGAAVLMLQDEG